MMKQIKHEYITRKKIRIFSGMFLCFNDKIKFNTLTGIQLRIIEVIFFLNWIDIFNDK